MENKISMESMYKEILGLKKEISSLKEILSNKDEIMTEYEEKEHEKALDELDKGDTISHGELKKELGLNA